VGHYKGLGYDGQRRVKTKTANAVAYVRVSTQGAAAQIGETVKGGDVSLDDVQAITEDAQRIAADLDGFGRASAMSPSPSIRQASLVKLTTDEGVEGIGGAWGPPSVTKAYLDLIAFYGPSPDLRFWGILHRDARERLS
jgi:hypothetical protein